MDLILLLLRLMLVVPFGLFKNAVENSFRTLSHELISILNVAMQGRLPTSIQREHSDVVNTRDDNLISFVNLICISTDAMTQTQRVRINQ